MSAMANKIIFIIAILVGVIILLRVRILLSDCEEENDKDYDER